MLLDDDEKESYRQYDLNRRRYMAELTRHPSCSDPDHPGCEDCEPEKDWDWLAD